MSPRIPGDGERWAELAQEMGVRLGHLVRDVVPEDAAAHLLNAQRELLTAFVLIYEHQAGARREPAPRQGARPANRRAAGARTRRTGAAGAGARRVDRIRVD